MCFLQGMSCILGYKYAKDTTTSHSYKCNREIAMLYYTNYKTNYLHQCIVLKSFYSLKPSTHIKINFKITPNMFRSHCTIIREHVVPIPKLPLTVY